MIKKGTLVALTLSLLLAGCSSPNALVVSFDDVTAQSDTKGENSDLTQTKSIALTGLMPTLWPGDLCYDKAGRSPASTICMAPRDKESFYRVRIIGDTITDQDVVGVRDALQDMVRAAEEYLEAKLALTKFELIQAERGKADKPAAAEQLTIDQNRTNLTSAVASKETAYSGKIAAAQQKLNKPGMMVFQWDSEQSTTIGAGVSELASGAFTSSKQRSGFGIVGGIRVSQLFLGSDLHKGAWPQLVKKKEDKKELVIPTTIFQAKNIAYFSEMERIVALKAQLSATFEQLAKVVEKPAILAAANLDLSFALSRMYKVTNTALLNSGTVTEERVNWGDRLPMKTQNQSAYWSTFYQVATQLKDLYGMVCEQCQ